MAITIAVLGTGSIGTRHYNCLAQIKDITPIAVPTRSERVGELRSQGINALEQIPDEAQGIVVATDTARHLSDWHQYQERFCLVEKPLAGDNTPELETLVADTQGRAFTACVLRFHRTLSEFKKLIDQSTEFKKAMCSCRSYLPDWRPLRDYRTLYSAQYGQGGALRELIHEIDYVGWIFGWPTSVKGIISDQKTIDIADEESALMFLENSNSQVQLELDIAAKESRRNIMSIQESSSYFCDLLEHEILNPKTNPPFQRFPEDRDNMYKRQLEAFVSAIKGDDSAPLATAEEGLRALKVIQAVRLSHSTGQPVNL